MRLALAFLLGWAARGLWQRLRESDRRLAPRPFLLSRETSADDDWLLEARR